MAAQTQRVSASELSALPADQRRIFEFMIVQIPFRAPNCNATACVIDGVTRSPNDARRSTCKAV
jgi:hypothetical protein